MLIAILISIIACGNETKEVRKKATKNKTTATEQSDVVITNKPTTSVSNKTTETTVNKNLENQKNDVKQYVEKSVNTVE